MAGAHAAQNRAAGFSLALSAPFTVAFLTIPGLIMAASVLLKRDGDPSEEAIRRGLTNICRCGVYPRVVEAVQRAGRAFRGEETIPAGVRPGIDPADAAHAVPALEPSAHGRAD